MDHVEIVFADQLDLDEVVARSHALIAVGRGALHGHALAALLFADWIVLADDATLHCDDAAVWAGIVWRLGSVALRFCLAMLQDVSAADALSWGLCDAVVPSRGDPVAQARAWLGRRSTLAFASAASLLRHRGGDTLERAEFARLFAIGEPQEGLRAFLEKRAPSFPAR